MNELLDAALYYARELQWCVFALAQASKIPPARSHGFHDATRDPDLIKAMWMHRPLSNIGIRTGPASDLFVLDVDPRHRGDESLERLIAKHGSLPHTFTVWTPGGGMHLYFRWPGISLRSTAGALDDGLDTRGEGGYVVGAGSVLRGGRVYRCDDECAPVAPMPSWFVRVLRKPERPAVPTRMISLPRDAALTIAGRVLQDRARQVASAPAGRRNVTLNAAAFYVGANFVAIGLLDSAEVWAVLGDAAMSAGLDDREIRATIASGLSAGIANPARNAS